MACRRRTRSHAKDLNNAGRIEFPYLGGMRMPWHDVYIPLSDSTRRVYTIIGLLLLTVALPSCVVAAIGAAI